LRRPDTRRKDGSPNIHRGYQHPLRTTQGFRVAWYFSSQKETLDRAAREHRIAAAGKALQLLAARVGAPRSRLNSLEQVSAAAHQILADKQVERFLHVEVTLLEEQRFTQASRGRPGPRTAYIRHSHQRPVLDWHSAEECFEPWRSENARWAVIARWPRAILPVHFESCRYFVPSNRSGAGGRSHGAETQGENCPDHGREQGHWV
jgi:hypothetical protein